MKAGLLLSVIQTSPLIGAETEATGNMLKPAVVVVDWNVCFVPAANVFDTPVSAKLPVGAVSDVPQADPVETGIPAPG
jgi:hypothetical protein